MTAARLSPLIGRDRNRLRSSPERGATGRDGESIAISIEGVSKSFMIDGDPSRTLKERLLTFKKAPTSRNFDALSDVSFEIKAGETFGILGHNGSGKSTLLKTIAGTIRPTSGRVMTRGRLSALLELGAGFHPDLTGRENIFLNGSILGIPKSRIEEIYEDIVRFAELEEFIHLQVKYYSSGMQGRLGFAVATNLDPDILLVDEVLSVGDEAFQAKCMERVHRFRQLGRTLVIVSHGTEQMRQLCNRVAILERGRLLFVGDTNEAIEIYRAALHGPRDDAGPDPAEQPPEPEVAAVGPPIALTSATIIDAPADQAIQPGAALEVSIEYEVEDPRDHAIRLILSTFDGTVLMTRSSADVLGQTLGGRRGRNEIRFRLERLPLLSGRYHLTALAESPDGSQTFSRLANFTDFGVNGPGAQFGPIEIPVSCTLPEPSEREGSVVVAGPDPASIQIP